MEAKSPVLYRPERNRRWQVGLLEDYSATGLSMECKQGLPLQSEISIQIKPGDNKRVPAVTGRGLVVRSHERDDGVFQVACKMLHIDRPED